MTGLRPGQSGETILTQAGDGVLAMRLNHAESAHAGKANLRPRGAGVVLEAAHTCMTQRGIRAHGATTVTSALLGTLRTDPRSRAEFFALARVPTTPEPM